MVPRIQVCVVRGQTELSALCVKGSGRRDTGFYAESYQSLANQVLRRQDAFFKTRLTKFFDGPTSAASEQQWVVRLGYHEDQEICYQFGVKPIYVQTDFHGGEEV